VVSAADPLRSLISGGIYTQNEICIYFSIRSQICEKLKPFYSEMVYEVMRYNFDLHSDGDG
jgi:hypothetical protein